jgi:YfiH family protein
MIRQNKNELNFVQFESFADYPLHQGIFGRKGGVSPDPWSSLNLGGLSGDSRENIIENRKRIFSCFDLPVESIFDVWQVHGNRVICTDTARPLDRDHEKADAIFTDNPHVTLFMRFADCVPLFFFDPVKKVVGVAHAGRMGTLNRIATDCVNAMKDGYGTRVDDIRAGIGPSIGPDHYEVKEDVASDAEACFADTEGILNQLPDGRIFLNLWEANRRILMEAGVRHIETAEICTACHTGDWFSHRAENGKTGRFGALLALNGTK